MTLENRLQTIFPNVNPDDLVKLASSCETKNIHGGDQIIKQGSSDKKAYILLSGRMRAIKRTPEGSKRLGDIETGEMFGEMALFLDAPRGSNVYAVRDSEVLVIGEAEFQNIVLKSAELLASISQVVIKRLAHINQGDSNVQNQHVVLLAPLNDQAAQSDFVQKLQDSMTSEGVALLTEEKENLSREIEKTQASYVFLLGKSTDQEWNKQCYRQCDQVIIFSHLDNSPELSDLERQLNLYEDEELRPDVALILLSDSSDIKNTQAWLQERRLKNHFHIRNSSDYSRMKRFLTGKSIKLVLGGGGARGFAHLGVYKAMLELGIPVDVVGGTSIGSIIASVIALQWDYDDIIKHCKAAFVQQNPLNDYQFPMISIIRGKKLKKTLLEHFENLRMEDAPLPFFAISANLSSATTEMIKEGPIWHAIRGSIALPVILPPVAHQNSLLVDGGIVDNLPFEPMQSMCSGYTIGVDLSTMKQRDLGYDEVPSTLSVMKSKVLGKRKYKVPNIFQTMMSTLTLASNDNRIKNISKFDLYIKPNLRKVGFLEWKAMEDAIEIGYRESFPLLEEWKKTMVL